MSVSSYYNAPKQSGILGQTTLYDAATRTQKSLLDPEMLRVGGSREGGLHAPAFFAQALQRAEAPGGILSNLNMNRRFSGQVSSILQAERSRGTEGMRALQQAGVSPQMAAAVYSENPYRALSAIAPVRAGLETELQSDRFAAYSQLALLVQQTEMAQMQAAFNRKSLRLGERAQNIGALQDLAGTAIGAYGAFGG